MQSAIALAPLFSSVSLLGASFVLSKPFVGWLIFLSRTTKGSLHTTLLPLVMAPREENTNLNASVK